MVDQDKTPDNWESPQKILVVLAHPDDPEFFCGGTTTRWIKSGHHVNYCLLTCGDKGTKDFSLDSRKLCSIRRAEQLAAAKVLGVEDVTFLNYPDGYLVADLKLRKDVTRINTQVTCHRKGFT